MTNPIIVDTVENSFIPLLIYNNKSSDSALLKKFKEPAWNFQVIRFLDADGKDIIMRKDKVWSKAALVPRMIQALEKAKQPVPTTLKLLQKETSQLQHAAFSQYCFWTGELRLGSIEGVITTEAGWLGGHEVTRVAYDPNQVSLKSLIAQATAFECSNSVYVPESQVVHVRKWTRKPVAVLTNKYRKARTSDQKRQLGGTRFANLDLTPAQATKVNAFARSDRAKAKSYLTKKQLADL